MEYDRLEFVDAIEELAGQLGLAVPTNKAPVNAAMKDSVATCTN